MKLLLDFGNSRLKWGTIGLDEKKLQVSEAIDYSHDGLHEKITKTVSILPYPQCETIHAVSVLGEEFNTEFARFVSKQYGLQAIFYHSQKEAFDVTLAYADPKAYGADRYAALIAAAQYDKGAKIIIDAGTAITIDAINAKNIHLGGLIFPGITAMYSALNQADGIGDGISPTNVEYLCNTTKSAVYSGSVLCVRHGIENIVKEITNQLDDEVVILLTGGGASVLMDEPSHQYVFSHDLVLRGVLAMQRF